MKLTSKSQSTESRTAADSRSVTKVALDIPCAAFGCHTTYYENRNALKFQIFSSNRSGNRIAHKNCVSHQVERHLLPHQAWRLLYCAEVARPEVIVHMSGCADCLRRLVIGLGCRTFGSYLMALGINPDSFQVASEEFESDPVCLEQLRKRNTVADSRQSLALEYPSEVSFT